LWLTTFIESDDCGTVKEITLELGDTGEPGARIEIAPLQELAAPG
jgi:hypothetical protein